MNTMNELKAYWGVALWAVLGLLTLLPASASKPNMLGYYSLCTFVPVSTVILWAIAAITYRIVRKKLAEKRATA